MRAAFSSTSQREGLKAHFSKFLIIPSSSYQSSHQWSSLINHIRLVRCSPGKQRSTEEISTAPTHTIINNAACRFLKKSFIYRCINVYIKKWNHLWQHDLYSVRGTTSQSCFNLFKTLGNMFSFFKIQTKKKQLLKSQKYIDTWSCTDSRDKLVSKCHVLYLLCSLGC